MNNLQKKTTSTCFTLDEITMQNLLSPFNCKEDPIGLKC